jgi:hypothetical protein
MLDQDKELENQFKTLFQRINETDILRIPDDITAVEPAAHAYFDAHVDDADPGAATDWFFNHIGTIWEWLLRARQYDLSECLWQEAIGIARRWEQQNQPRLLHKGTPFYFWGGTAVLRGNVRKGFLLIHAALVEDKRKHYRQDEDPDTPARKFVTLDARTDAQALRDLVKTGTNELEKRLAKYRAVSGSNLQFSDMQSRYATQHDVREIVFIFTMTVFEAITLRESFQQVGAGAEFGAQLAANCLFDLCQVVEESIRVKNPNGHTFKSHADFLSQWFGWPRNYSPLDDINKQQNTNFDATVRALITNTAVAGMPVHRRRPPVCSLERDLWLTYVLRNSTAHSLASRVILQKHFNVIYQCVLNTLFAVVDNLYL